MTEYVTCIECQHTQYTVWSVSGLQRSDCTIGDNSRVQSRQQHTAAQSSLQWSHLRASMTVTSTKVGGGFMWMHRGCCQAVAWAVQAA